MHQHPAECWDLAYALNSSTCALHDNYERLIYLLLFRCIFNTSMTRHDHSFADLYVGGFIQESRGPITEIVVNKVETGIKIHGRGRRWIWMLVQLLIFLLCDFFVKSVFWFPKQSSKECNNDVTKKRLLTVPDRQQTIAQHLHKKSLRHRKRRK